MSKDTVTVDLTTNQIHYLIGKSRGTLVEQSLTDALAVHEAAQNPLGTPWETVNRGAGQEGCWAVLYSDARDSDNSMTEAQAKLMAAAPELADAVERWVELFRANGHYPADCMESKAALVKAGRR